MKKLLYFTVSVIFFTLLLTGCTGVKTVATGLENEAFLEFVGTPGDYRGGVDVSIDNNTFFKAEINKEHVNRPKGKVYAITTGKHILSVSYNNNLIYQKEIFVSTQETKRIILP